MSVAVRGDAVWAALTYHVSDRARLGRLRAAGLQEIAAATGCVTHVHRRSAGITLDVHGARPLVQHLADTLDTLAALMDSCALAATRRYGQWLRDQPDPDHTAHERPNLRRAWRRAYLTAWAGAYSHRLLRLATGRPDKAPHQPPPMGHHRAHAHAWHDVAELDSTGLRATAAAMAATRKRDGTAAGRADRSAPPAGRLVIVACSAAKQPEMREYPAGQLYTGSFHAAARRAADVIAGPTGKIMILSARYGLLNLDQPVLPYEQRLGQPGAVTAEYLREQARQMGLLPTREVIALAPRAYAELVAEVWPHALLPLRGTSGIGHQRARLADLAGGRSPPPTSRTPCRTVPAERRYAGRHAAALSVAPGLVATPCPPIGTSHPPIKSGAAARHPRATKATEPGPAHTAGRPQPTSAAVPADTAAAKKGPDHVGLQRAQQRHQ